MTRHTNRIALALSLALLSSCVVARGPYGTIAMMGTDAEELTATGAAGGVVAGEAGLPPGSFHMKKVNQSTGLGKATGLGEKGLSAWTTSKVIDGTVDITGTALTKGVDLLKSNKSADTSIKKAEIDAGTTKAQIDAAQ